MSTETKAVHTPGAERAAQLIALDHPAATDKNLGQMICNFAELIDRETAAPDMLEALKEMVTVMRANPKMSAIKLLEAVEKSEAAIRKAEGS